MKTKNPYKKYERYVFVSDNNEIMGYMIQMNDNESSPEFQANGHVAFTNIRIREKYRKNGLGKEAVKFLKDKAQEKGCKVLELFSSNDPAKAVADKMGLEILHTHYVNRVFLKDINWDLMHEWVKSGPKKALGVRLERHNTIPDEDLEAFIALYTETVNQAPWGADTLEVITPESYRVRERDSAEKGTEVTTIYSREENGALSGITEIYYDPLNPEEVSQELTGVKDEYRKRGLGKWLKAEMVLSIKGKYPTARYITTGNAVNNEAMLTINHQMGFRETNVFHLYRIPV